MGKIEEAQDILDALGLLASYRNELAALTLLALANLKEDDSWNAAIQRTKRIHDIIIFVNNSYGKNYAENTRESIRKNALNPFEHERIINRNPDDPTRPTNSGNTCYAISDEAKSVIEKYGTDEFQVARDHFLKDKPKLQKKRDKEREMHQIKVDLSSGETLALSPGKHNELQLAVIRDFYPFFIPEAVLLYVGDTTKKDLHVDKVNLEQVGLPYSIHEKYPDLVFWLQEKHWLICIEAVTSHGPFDEKRKKELERLLEHSSCKPIFVTAFALWKEFKKYLDKLAWDTEVWIASVPEHMIHYNGPKFLC